MLRYLIKHKNNKYLPENDIMDILKEFGITKEDKEYTMKALIVADKSNIVYGANGMCSLKYNPKTIKMYEYNEKTYKILKELFKYKVILEVNIKNIDSSYILDMQNYNSVKNTYEMIKLHDIDIKDDKELINYAVTKLFPRKRLVIHSIRLGKKAFPGSKITQFKLTCMECFDTELITSLRTIKDTK